MPDTKRILFVDDEPRVLQGMQNSLRKQRHAWDMVFAPGPEAALAELERGSFDVIITDMRMPHMDGAALLKRVQAKHPEIVRIVLSGQTDQEMARRAVTVAHQFLAKPCDGEMIRNVIRRACDLQALLQDKTLRSIVGSIDRLPSVPHLYHELTAALDAPSSSMASVGAIVQRDTALTAKILQAVNSAFFGNGRPTTNLAQALNYLGLDILKSLVLLVHAGGFSNNHRDQASRIQIHAFNIARIASLIARGRLDEKEAFTAGMLADIGRLVLAAHGNTGAPFEGEARAQKIPLHVAEERRLGFTHAEIGAYLLGLWSIPLPIVEAVAHHHAPHRVASGDLDLTTVLHVADAMSAAIMCGATEVPSEIDLRHLERSDLAAALPGLFQEANELIARKETR
jgi:HD-like signal output (HDOD) protein